MKQKVFFILLLVGAVIGFAMQWVVPFIKSRPSDINAHRRVGMIGIERVYAAELPQVDTTSMRETPMLKTGVSWNVDSARGETFKDLDRNIEPGQYPLMDPNFKDSLSARLAHDETMGNRSISYFSNGDYCYYTIGDYESYCYRYSGKAFKISVSSKPRGMNQYPNRDVDYDPKTGKMLAVGLYVSRMESYVYYPDGKLIAHWQGTNAFDGGGNLILTRQTSNK